MSLTRTFNFSFDVSDEFVAKEPDAAAKWVAIAKQRIAKRVTAEGPRGGTYVLVTSPDVWESSNDSGWDFIRGQTRHFTRRRGRYVRPSRAPLIPDSMTFETVTIPVVEGAVTLPDGRRIETAYPFVDVPVLA